MSTTNNIVIIGGGFAGISIANALEKALAKTKDTKHRIILIEKVRTYTQKTFIFSN